MASRRTLNQYMFELRTPPARPGDVRPAGDVEPCSCALVGDQAHAHVYNEEAFRYFLEIERKRSEISNRPFLLLLLDLKKDPQAHANIDRATAERLFAVLTTCVRETDFIGWYRAGSVVGAVLTQHADGLGADAQETVRRRVIDIVGQRVSAELATRVQIRVYQAPPSVQS